MLNRESWSRKTLLTFQKKDKMSIVLFHFCFQQLYGIRLIKNFTFKFERVSVASGPVAIKMNWTNTNFTGLTPHADLRESNSEYSFNFLLLINQQEVFLDLPVTLMGCSSLEESLQTLYISVEILEGRNQYRCGACDKLVDAIKVSC